MSKILVTGGHVTPALAVMAVLKKRGWDIVYVGRTHAIEGDNAISQEKLAIEKAEYRFKSLITGRLQRQFTPHTIPSLLKIPIGFIESLFILLKERPQIILSFGGYVALPLVLVGWLLRIPVVTHEQTKSVGLANRIIGKLAQKICVSWKDQLTAFHPDKVVYTGNPLRQEIFQTQEKLPIKLDKPLLYVTGGNLGAHSLNQIVAQILPQLLTSYSVIHQCGNAQEFKDYEILLEKRTKLAPLLASRYYPCEYIDSAHIGWVLSQAQILVSRSGANIVTEVIALKKSTLFIPLPWAGSGEQTANADLLVREQAALLLDQTELSPERLLSEINHLFHEQNKIGKRLQALQSLIVKDADSKIADVVESVV